MQTLNLPLNVRLVDDNGYMTHEWRNALTRNNQQVQIHLNEDGYSIPTKTTDQLSVIDTSDYENKLVVESTKGKLAINIGGTFVGVDTSPL